MNPFFQLYQGLSREGPGEAADVKWAAELAGLKPEARICDVACGSGADTQEWLQTAPMGHVTAFDKRQHFIKEARARLGENPRLTLCTGDMTSPLANGPFDMIWCAGAVYFMGITKALELWRPALATNGTIVFSEVCWWTDTPNQMARTFWSDAYPQMTNTTGITTHIQASGYKVVATRHVSLNGWAGYYDGLQANIDALRTKANTELTAILDETQGEIDLWKSCSNDFGYLLSMVQPE